MPRKHPLYYVWANMKARCKDPNRLITAGTAVEELHIVLGGNRLMRG